jgi:hypothetical protein
MSENERYPIEVYGKDFNFKNIKIENIIEDVFMGTVIIGELHKVPYYELIQNSFVKAFNPNLLEDEIQTTFLYWCNDILFDIGQLRDTMDTSEKEAILLIPYFIYTDVNKYQDVKYETVFERKTKVCMIKTSRPLYVKIIDLIKKQVKDNISEPTIKQTNGENE